MDPATSGSSVGPARLNPFAFAVDTDSRFVLLIFAVITATFFLSTGLYNRLPETKDLHARIEAACAARAAELPSEGPGLFAGSAAQAAVAACTAPANAVRTQAALIGTAGLLGTASALYWAYPAWIRRQRRLVPLEPGQLAALDADLAAVRASVELERWPTFVSNPDPDSRAALAFGRAGSYFVALGRGLLDQRATDPEAFRAVLAHELAHIRNRDVDTAYLTVVLWRCFLIALILWIAVTSIGAPVGESVHYGLRLGALALVVYLTHAAVLRARELYADVRASSTPGVQSALVRLFGRASWRGWRPEFLRLHPQPSTRGEVVARPELLFGVQPAVAFAAGLVAAAGSATFPYIVGSVLPIEGVWLEMIGTISGASLLVWIVGLGTWRASFAAIVGRRSMRIASVAAGAGLGWSVGLHASLLEAAIAADTAHEHLTGVPAIVVEAVAAAISIGAIWLVVAWIGTTAQAWIPRALGRPIARFAYVAALILAGVLLGVALFATSFVRLLRLDPQTLSGDRISAELAPIGMQLAPADAQMALLLIALLVAVMNPVTFVTAILGWAFPLAATLVPQRVIKLSNIDWAFLDRPPDGELAAQSGELRFGRIVRAGIVGSILLVLVIGAVLAMVLLMSVVTGVIVLIVVALVIQASIAIWIARPTRSLSVSQAAFGTWIAATLACVAIALLVALIGRDLGLATALGTAIWLLITNLGALASLVVAPRVARGADVPPEFSTGRSAVS